MKELVGQGKPFYSALDKAAGLLRRKVGTGSEFLKELMSIPGVKQAEIAERGLGELLNAPKMTHEQFMAALGTKPAPAIHEKVFANKLLKNPGADPDPHHEDYTLPGGENYREMLIKAPKGVNNQEKIMELEAKLRRIPMFNSTPEQQAQIATYYNQVRDLKAQEAASPKPFQGVSQHFGGEEGILASMRLKDRTGPNGEKLLHLEELQSDWHQQGRDKGYGSQLTSEDEAKIADFEARQRHQANPVGEPLTIADRADWAGLINKRDGAVPDAPFKKNWEEMALKRLIHHAAENGYHGVVVTPGAEQADRYGLAKHVGMVSYHPGEKRFQAFKPNRETVVNEKDASPDRVAELIGKEAAQRLLAAPKVGDHHFLEGEDLNIGGEGMKGFYDKKVPNILNGIGKKYGVKTELGGHKLRDPNGRSDAAMKLGVTPQQYAGMSPDERNAFHEKLDDINAKPLHYFPITEDMRQDVKKNGIPLYKSGGTVSTH